MKPPLGAAHRNPTPDTEHPLRAAVLDHIRTAARRQTTAMVITAVCRATGAARRSVRAAISHLLEQQDLMYSYELGCSFLVENTLRPWRATPQIWVAPPDHTPPEPLSPDAIILRLQSGAAFGGEGHATTRLCLLALDYLFQTQSHRPCYSGPAIDVGTGTGILAIAAAKRGSPLVTALDIDACARAEAVSNIALNQLSHRVQVGGASYDTIANTFTLMLANLRTPTLIRLLSWAALHLATEGRIVVSGFLRTESHTVAAHFRAAGLRQCWSAVEKRWAGACFARNPVQGGEIEK
ncbi:MAG: 50S ribosomal protein L11 methyltransferase [Desulfosarcinaceae bacterium]|nr:50S ribosomal protein L11 methyltransferase [Desulfosarcinaceae bacterium]